MQPGFGGPFYWIRNIVYNTTNVFKYIENSAGILTYNNTIIGEGALGLRRRTCTSAITSI